MTRVGHALHLKANKQLQWGEKIYKKKERKEETFKAYQSYDYDTIDIIGKILTR